MTEFFVYPFLMIAVGMDLYCGRIKNYYIIAGLFISFALHLWQENPFAALQYFFHMCLVILLLIPFFAVRAIGAGDVKLLGVLAFSIGFSQTFMCIIIAFIIGAVFSLLKMLFYQNLFNRYTYLYSYLKENLIKDRWFYTYHGENFDKKSIIHFTIPILLGFIINHKFGGLIWTMF